MVREAIARTGRVALTRVVISQRERTVALRPIEGGLVAHTLNEQRDLNDPKTLFDTVRAAALDPEMVKLAVQLVDRQTGRYDPSDLEDRYETRLREMLDAKVKGEAVETDAPAPAMSNVVDIMAALRQSLGQDSGRAVPKAAGARRAEGARENLARAQPAFKLPIAGGKSKAPKPTEADAATPRPNRSRRAS